MVPDFMADHVRVCKLSRRAQLLSHHVEKRKVQVDDMVARTIERPGDCFPHAAGRWIAITVQAQLRLLVGRAPLLERGRPNLLGASQNLRYEFRLRVTGGWGLWLV